MPKRSFEEKNTFFNPAKISLVVLFSLLVRLTIVDKLSKVLGADDRVVLLLRSSCTFILLVVKSFLVVGKELSAEVAGLLVIL